MLGDLPSGAPPGKLLAVQVVMLIGMRVVMVSPPRPVVSLPSSYSRRACSPTLPASRSSTPTPGYGQPRKCVLRLLGLCWSPDRR
jgi:hypothetical protein